MQTELSFRKEEPKRENIDKNNNQNQISELHFTGNWFIDAGILGFVNLMEDVYGWDLNTLQQKIKNNPNEVYYGYFPIAFVYCNCKETKKQEKELEKPTETELDKKFCWIPPQDKKGIFEEAWKFIRNNYRDSKRDRIKLSSGGRWNFFHNFLFFQSSWKEDKQKNGLLEILGIEKPQKDVLRHIDKTINKFLPSAGEFSNLSYTKSFITSSNLEELLPNLAFMLTFPLAFTDIEKNKKSMLFYSPNIKFTYNVNKRVKVELKKLSEGGGSVFRITWETVLDSVVEMESLWSIENMYLIKYSGIRQQQILDVEYIGIPKLQASIILDDTIRDNLNRNISLEENRDCWLLEEFINNKPLYPIILKHIWWLGIKRNNNQLVAKTTSLYALAIDANIKYLNENNKNRLFSIDFFMGYEWLVDKIKEDYNSMRNESYNMRDIFRSSNREEIVYSLFSAIKSHNKKEFLYLITKNLLDIKDENIDKVSRIIKYLFEKILNNDICWENYALALIVNITE